MSGYTLDQFLADKARRGKSATWPEYLSDINTQNQKEKQERLRREEQIQNENSYMFR